MMHAKIQVDLKSFMMSKRNQMQKRAWLHLEESVEQAKLIYSETHLGCVGLEIGEFDCKGTHQNI